MLYASAYKDGILGDLTNVDHGKNSILNLQALPYATYWKIQL